MRKLAVFNLFMAVALILGSCATSNDVVSNRMISKRKYTKGLFIKKNGATKTKGDVKEVELAKSNESESKSVNYRSVSSPNQTAELPVADVESNTIYPSQSSDDYASTENDISSLVIPASQRTIEDNATEEETVAEIEVTKEQRKEVKQVLKNQKKQDNSASDADLIFILIVIITIIIPPLGVLIYTNIDWVKVLISLLLTLLFYLPGLIYSLLVIFDVI